MSRNVMLYWDAANPFPTDIIDVRDEWRKKCPEWNVMLYGKETARRYLLHNFGGDIARLFLTCAIPAMRADFFRVFWAISEGGVYSDVKFSPKREPTFFDPRKDFTVTIRPDGKIIKNGVFFAKKDCKELKLIAYEIIKSVSERKIPDIMHATGPILWTKVLSLHDTGTMTVLKWDELYRKYLHRRSFPSNTKGTDMYWLELEKRMCIYNDPPEDSGGKILLG